MSIQLAKIPSLDLIRGFVAVGRRMSITLAAQDLFLTQSAVSRQIHGLEEALGVKLFLRSHRAIAFTPEGERLFRVADNSMQQLQDVVGAMQDDLRQRPVTVTASIGFVGLWLLPRLGRFQQKHPEIEIRLSANNQAVDLRQEGVDVAIRYCAETAAPEDARRLFGETISPVAHAALGIDSLIDPEVIANSVLLEFDGDIRPWWSWQTWLAMQGWSGIKPKGILRFNQYDQMIYAALAGQGIALGRRELIADMLADGRLLALETPQAGPASSQIYCLMQADPSPRKEIQAVIDWVCEEARLTLSSLD